MQETNPTANPETIPTGLDLARVYGKLFRVTALNLPRLAVHQFKNIGDHSPERADRDEAVLDPIRIKVVRYVLKREIGSLGYRLRQADRLEEVKERRSLSSAALAKEM